MKVKEIAEKTKKEIQEQKTKEKQIIDVWTEEKIKDFLKELEDTGRAITMVDRNQKKFFIRNPYGLNIVIPFSFTYEEAVNYAGRKIGEFWGR